MGIGEVLWGLLFGFLILLVLVSSVQEQKEKEQMKNKIAQLTKDVEKIKGGCNE